MQDKLMPIIQVDSIDEVRSFYLEVLGFEEGATPPDLANAFASFSYGSSHIGVTTDEGLPALSASTRGGSLMIIEISDAVGIRNVMAKRHEDVVGAVQTGWWGAYFDVPDPAGNIFRFLQKAAAISYDGGDDSGAPESGAVEGDA